VTKNSGGPMTAAKLTAARHLGVHVVMVARPPLPPASKAMATVEAALRWLDAEGKIIQKGSLALWPPWGHSAKDLRSVILISRVAARGDHPGGAGAVAHHAGLA
jgi:hypothetical protein